VFLYGDRTFAEIDAEEKDRVSHRAGRSPRCGRGSQRF
jgi:inosine/xanthosine triphosphate pyrophosphatase family protein